MVVIGVSAFFDGRFGNPAVVEVSGCAYESRLGRVVLVRRGGHVQNVRVRAHGDPDIRASTIWRWTTFRQFPEWMRVGRMNVWGKYREKKIKFNLRNLKLPSAK